VPRGTPYIHNLYCMYISRYPRCMYINIFQHFFFQYLNRLSKSTMPPLESSEELMTSSPTVPRVLSRKSSAAPQIKPSSRLQTSFCFQLDDDTTHTKTTSDDVDWYVKQFVLISLRLIISYVGNLLVCVKV